MKSATKSKSEIIRVGHLVRSPRSPWNFEVIAIHGEEAWIRSEERQISLIVAVVDLRLAGESA